MKISCGILPYRIQNGNLEVFLVHPGGPFFTNKNQGYWGIAKGQLEKNEDYIDCAIREFMEETGVDLTIEKERLISIGFLKLIGGKEVYVWAIEYRKEIIIKSQLITINWPPGKTQLIPEIDRGEFLKIESAMELINPKQAEFLDKLRQSLKLE